MYLCNQTVPRYFQRGSLTNYLMIVLHQGYFHYTMFLHILLNQMKSAQKFASIEVGGLRFSIGIVAT